MSEGSPAPIHGNREDALSSLADAVRDVCWKATPFGETEDGDVAAYIIPKAAIHRLVAAAQSAGVSASLRNLPSTT